MNELPALQIAESLNREVQSHDVVVVTAPPGAGKSTLLPLTLLDGLSPQGTILLVEPRRVAARQVAERLAGNRGEPVGQTVGYSVRFDRKVSRSTRIEVVTEGVMMRKLLRDPLLDGVSLVILDEFHERSLTLDVILALIREIQQLFRPELKLVLMSATLNADEICSRLNAPLVACEGRLFEVETRLKPRQADTTDPSSIAQDVVRVIREACKTHEGDILAFLPGQAEINRCQQLLGDAWENTRIYPLFGLLPAEQQRQALAPSPEGARKIVLATSLAETSLTIEGVRVVVDSGFCRKPVFDPNTGLSHLETVRISRDRMIQRRGRAGRVASGVCYQLWNPALALTLEETRTPEILEADLSGALLDLFAWGEPDMEALPWLTPPPHSSVIQAKLLLESLGAILPDNKGNYILSEKGKRMAEIPCHPRLSSMLVSAGSAYEKALAADLAALLEERDPLAGVGNDADLNTRLSVLRQLRRRGNPGKWSQIEKIARQYTQLLGVQTEDCGVDPEETGRLLACAYPERVGRLQGVGRYRLAGTGNATLDQKDSLSAQEWIVVASMNAQTGKVFLASPVSPDCLRQTSYEHVSWDSQEGCIAARCEQRIGRLVVNSKPLPDLPTETVHALLAQAAQKEGLSLFSFDDGVKLLQRRIQAVAQWHAEIRIPDVSTTAVLARADEWIPLFAGKATTQKELRKIDMQEVVWSLLPYELRQMVERLAPSHIQMPNGHRIRLDYRQGAEAPVLSVRLQECFGMKETPRVDDDRQPVLMELLSPGFKPVQLTKDLGSFWRTTYFEVRKELRRRYPKHQWPEDPDISAL